MAYVYRHIRLDKNEPFYIGIGKGTRSSWKYGRNPIWKNISNKTEYDVEILFDDVSWDFACKKEIEFIKLYGRIDLKTGVLANMTDGGEGGKNFSIETLLKISEASKKRVGYWRGKNMSEETKKKLSETKTGKPNYKSRGKKVSDLVKSAVSKHATGNKYRVGVKHTDETKKKLSEMKNGIVMPTRKQVFQYSIGGEFIKQYDSLTIAMNENKLRDIHTVCKGYRRTSGGYMWRYEYLGDKIDGVRPKSSRWWKNRM